MFYTCISRMILVPHYDTGYGTYADPSVDLFVSCSDQGVCIVLQRRLGALKFVTKYATNLAPNNLISCWDFLLPTPSLLAQRIWKSRFKKPTWQLRPKSEKCGRAGIWNFGFSYDYYSMMNKIKKWLCVSINHTAVTTYTIGTQGTYESPLLKHCIRGAWSYYWLKPRSGLTFLSHVLRAVYYATKYSTSNYCLFCSF
jgi:hypothetical protein